MKIAIKHMNEHPQTAVKLYCPLPLPFLCAIATTVFFLLFDEDDDNETNKKGKKRKKKFENNSSLSFVHTLFPKLFSLNKMEKF